MVSEQSMAGKRFWFGLFDLRPYQHDNGYLDGWSQIKVHTDERTQVHSAQSSLAVTHPGTNRARRSLTSVTESPSKHWSPLRTFCWQKVMESRMVSSHGMVSNGRIELNRRKLSISVE